MIWKLMKKEWKEFLKTGRLYVLLFVFLFFGVSSPAIAKFTPELIKSLVQGEDFQGLIIQMPPPTWKDSFLQFFKNLNQLIFFVLVLVFIGSIAEEKNKGTAQVICALGVDRKKFVLSKFIFQTISSMIFVIFSYMLVAYYTYFLFSDVDIYSSFFATILYLIYIIFVLSLCIFSSSIGGSTLQAGGIFFVVFILLNILSIFPKLQPYNPITLSSLQNSYIIKGVMWSEAIRPIVSTLIISILLLINAIWHFDRKDL
ncbi:MAG TPA: ABC transporter permease subunit [Dictyoglomaceae bacterium]|nr:ABC transporter permease subunit [Dictyoglomaceae bacterium]